MSLLEKGSNWMPVTNSFPYKQLKNTVNLLYGDVATGRVSEYWFPNSFQFQTTLTINDFDNPFIFGNDRSIKSFLATMRELYK